MQSEWEEGNEVTQSILLGAETKLCFYNCPTCDPDVTANLIHASCLQLLKAKANPRGIEISAEFLCRAARMLRPTLEWRRAVAILDVQASPSQFPPLDGPHSTELSILVSSIQKKLPLEIQGMILDCLPSHCLFYPLSRCLEVLETINFDRILKANLPFSEFTTKYPFPIDQPSPVRLSATTVNILGEECLATIGTQANTMLGLSVGQAKIRGLQYAMGSYGVVALRLLYEDGTRSGWMGQSIRKWVATIRGKEMASLNFMTDVRNPPPNPLQLHGWGNHH